MEESRFEQLKAVEIRIYPGDCTLKTEQRVKQNDKEIKTLQLFRLEKNCKGKKQGNTTIFTSENNSNLKKDR